MSLILVWLAQNKGATALEIGRACGMNFSIVRERLALLERHALVAGRLNGSIPPRRAYFVTLEGRRVVGLDDEATARR